jgi:Tfp pilus assembly protein PilF
MHAVWEPVPPPPPGGDAAAYLARALTHLAQGDQVAAMRDLTQAIELDGTLIEAYYHRALVFLAAGELDAADVDLERGLSADPKHSRLWAAKGRLRSEQDIETEAVVCYSLALRETADLDTAEVLFRRGASQHALGNHAAGLSDWDRHLEQIAERGEISPYADDIADFTAYLNRTLGTTEDSA